ASEAKHRRSGPYRGPVAAEGAGTETYGTSDPTARLDPGQDPRGLGDDRGRTGDLPVKKGPRGAIAALPVGDQFPSEDPNGLVGQASRTRRARADATPHRRPLSRRADRSGPSVRRRDRGG